MSAYPQATNDVWLPIEPFREFMERVVEAESVRMRLTDDDENRHDGYCGVGALSLAAARMGVQRKTFAGYLRGATDKISLRSVDQMLTSHGDYSIWDVYPQEILENIKIAIAKETRLCESCGIELIAKTKVKRCGFCCEEERHGNER